MDGTADRGDGPDSRLDHRRFDPGGTPGRLPVRRHLRLGQRDRLRRSARPTRHRRRRSGVAQPRCRDRRRGRLSPRRRGTGAACAGGHFASGDPQTGDRAIGRSAGRRRGCGPLLRHRRRQSQRASDRGRRAVAGEGARWDRPLRRGERRDDSDRGQRRPARPCAPSARCALHRPRRRGPVDQRLPWTNRRTAALAGRPAGGGRGQGGHRDHRDR